jgi:hypothetical protein
MLAYLSVPKVLMLFFFSILNYITLDNVKWHVEINRYSSNVNITGLTSLLRNVAGAKWRLQHEDWSPSTRRSQPEKCLSKKQ